MLLKCHDEAYTHPPHPLPTFHLRKHLAKVAAWKRSVESTSQKAKPHLNNRMNSFFLNVFSIAKAAQNAPFICFGAGLSSVWEERRDSLCTEFLHAVGTGEDSTQC